MKSKVTIGRKNCFVKKLNKQQTMPLRKLWSSMNHTRIRDVIVILLQLVIPVVK